MYALGAVLKIPVVHLKPKPNMRVRAPVVK